MSQNNKNKLVYVYVLDEGNDIANDRICMSISIILLSTA